jgi:hypothetical protein
MEFLEISQSKRNIEKKFLKLQKKRLKFLVKTFILKEKVLLLLFLI